MKCEHIWLFANPTALGQCLIVYCKFCGNDREGNKVMVPVIELDQIRHRIWDVSVKIEALCTALVDAGRQFRHYETLHLAKPDLEKAKTNEIMAVLCERAIEEARK